MYIESQNPTILSNRNYRTEYVNTDHFLIPTIYGIAKREHVPWGLLWPLAGRSVSPGEFSKAACLFRHLLVIITPRGIKKLRVNSTSAPIDELHNALMDCFGVLFCLASFSLFYLGINFVFFCYIFFSITYCASKKSLLTALDF